MRRLTPFAAAFFAITTLPAHANEIYRPSPREAYAPATYCRWNQTGLPKRFQDICAARNSDDRPRWLKIAPDLYLNMRSVSHTVQGGVFADAYFGPAGTMNLAGFKQLYFDCNGQFSFAGESGPLPASEGTAIGSLAAIACVMQDGGPSGAVIDSSHAAVSGGRITSPNQQ